MKEAMILALFEPQKRLLFKDASGTVECIAVPEMPQIPFEFITV